MELFSRRAKKTDSFGKFSILLGRSFTKTFDVMASFAIAIACLLRASAINSLAT
jgi:hypothetical protein